MNLPACNLCTCNHSLLRLVPYGEPLPAGRLLATRPYWRLYRSFVWRRWLRIAPTYYVCILIGILIFPSFTNLYNSCETHWWTNVLFINNFWGDGGWQVWRPHAKRTPGHLTAAFLLRAHPPPARLPAPCPRCQLCICVHLSIHSVPAPALTLCVRTVSSVMHDGGSCSLGQSWSIAVEFQFYFLSPLVLLGLLHGQAFASKRGFLLSDVPAPFLFVRDRVRGHALLMYLILFSTAARAVVLLAAAQGNGWYAFFDTLHMYTPVWTRMGPYLLGMGSAHHYLCVWHCQRPHWLERNDTHAKLARWSAHAFLGLLWLVIATFGIGGGDGIGFRLSWLPAYGPPTGLPTVTMGQPGPAVQVALGIFGRLVFSACVCYFILMTLVGRARYLRAVLSMRMLVPIARLSYGACA